MEKTELDNSNNKLGALNIIVIVLSIYVLGALVIDTLFVLPKETSKLLEYIDYVICLFFFFEFCIRFYKAENKLKFMQWGWIDLLSSIPMVDYLRAGRILRLIRLLRVIRAFRSTQHLVNHIFANKVQGAFTSISVIAILLVIFSAIGILQVENDPNSNIKTAEDAIWWAYVTITTVGYGDKFPVTTEGRIIAAILMTAGVGLFGTFTAFVASWFVVENKSSEENKESN
jgi:voltage-gated potassium channel